MKPRTLAAALGIVGLLAAGCGSDDDDAGSADAEVSSSEAPDATTADTESASTGAADETVESTAATTGEAADGTSSAGENPSGEPVEEIFIGDIAALTGPQADIGRQHREGVDLAVKQINEAGGIECLEGAQLVVEHADSTGRPEVASAETIRLIDDGAVALIGGVPSSAAVVSVQVSSDAGIPQLIPLSAADNITDQGFEHVFQIIEENGRGGPSAAELLSDLIQQTDLPDDPRIAMINYDDVAGVGISEATEAALKERGLNVVDRVQYNRDTPDLTGELTKLRDADPDILIMSASYEDAGLVLRTMRQLDFNVDLIYGLRVAALVDPNFAAELGTTADYAMTTDVALDAVGEVGQAAIAAFEEEYGDQASVLSIYPYVAVQVLADALERACSTDPAAISAALSETNLADHALAGGPIQFDENGRNVGAQSVILQAEGGSVNVVFPSEFATAEPILPIPAWSERD